MKDLLQSMNKRTIRADLNSGVVVFLVAIPLCLGIALASEAPLMSGIIAGIIGGIVIGSIGGSALGVSGPAAGLVAVIIAAQVTLGSFEAVLLATMIAGAIQLLLGVIRAGVIAYFFPTAVIKGMLAAIGIIIVLKQIPHAFGDDLDFEGNLTLFGAEGTNIFTEIGAFFAQVQPSAIIITIVGLVMLIVWNRPVLQRFRFFQIIPGPLAVVLTGVAMQLTLGWIHPEWTLGDSHLVNIPADSGPAEWIMLPDFSQIGNIDVWITGLVIAAVASVESLLCAEATDKLDPDRRITPMNKELRAQGIGNLLSGLVGGLPITQVIVRSSANIQSGGKTRFSAIFHGLLILVAVLAFPGFLNLIPLSALAAVLIMVGYKLAHPALWKKMYHTGWSQFIPFFITVVCIVVSKDLLIGIGIGMAVGILFVLHRNFRIPYTYQVTRDNNRPVINIKLSEVVSFLNKGNIITTLRVVPDGAHVVIDATQTMYIDPDVIDGLEDFKENAAHRGITFAIRGLDQLTGQAMPSPAKSLLKELEAHRKEEPPSSVVDNHDVSNSDMEEIAPA